MLKTTKVSIVVPDPATSLPDWYDATPNHHAAVIRTEEEVIQMHEDGGGVQNSFNVGFKAGMPPEVKLGYTHGDTGTSP